MVVAAAAVGDSVGVIKVSAARNHMKAVTNFDEVSAASSSLSGTKWCAHIYMRLRLPCTHIIFSINFLVCSFILFLFSFPSRYIDASRAAYEIVSVRCALYHVF